MNAIMSGLLQRAGLRWPLSTRPVSGPPPALEIFEDCGTTEVRSDSNKHVKIRDRFDKTGFECFINHVHLPFDGSNEALSSCLEYASLLHDTLIPLSSNRRLRIIVSLPENAEFPDAACTCGFTRSDLEKRGLPRTLKNTNRKHYWSLMLLLQSAPLLQKNRAAIKPPAD